MPRIGRGAILYHRQWRTHPILTLADNVRTGDDFARFHFQHRLSVTVFGLHGSYIVVKNSVEKQIGFDFGPKGSITEDAFWAMVAMQDGYRCRWVDGYLEEQSTQSVSDFVRQRRRWFQGLAKVALYAPCDCGGDSASDSTPHSGRWLRSLRCIRLAISSTGSRSGRGSRYSRTYHWRPLELSTSSGYVPTSTNTESQVA